MDDIYFSFARSASAVSVLYVTGRGASRASTVSLPWGLEPAIHEACEAEEGKKIQRHRHKQRGVI